VRGQRQSFGEAAAGHDDKRRSGSCAGNRKHVPDEAFVVMAVEGPVLEPLDRAEEVNVPGYRLTVRPDEVNLGVVLPVPPSAYRLSSGPALVWNQAGEVIRG
jgi:hypothetical protein